MNTLIIILLTLMAALSGCTSKKGDHACVEIYTKEFGKTVCKSYTANSSGCWGNKCDTDYSYGILVTLRCDGNALIVENVECP